MSDETSTHQGQGEIIIVKKVQGGGGGHHGGAWKIAYADFVTAMMAFFLVMWLVNAANEDTKASVASYFNPIKLTDSSPSTKDVKDNGESQQGENSQEASKTDGKETTTGDGAAEGNQEKSTAGEQTENSEADYFENPYAVLSEIVMEAAEESNISEKGDGGAQNSGAATGASGGQAYRDPFDPDFWSKQIANNPDAANQEAATEEKKEGEDVAETGGSFKLELGAGDVYDKNAGAGDNVDIGAAISDHDMGGNKTGLAEFDGDRGGKEFAEDGRHITNLPEDDVRSSSTLPAGKTDVKDIDPTKLATLFDEGNKKLDRLVEKGVTERLSPDEAKELIELVKASKQRELDPKEIARKEQLLAKNEAAKETGQKIAELQKELEKYKEIAAELDQANKKLSAAEKLEKEIRTALGGATGKLSEGFAVTPAEGGLLLSLTDQVNVGMFNIGSAVPKRDMILLMEKIGQVLNEKEGAITIRGHTDARPYSSGGNDNWRLSMARAHSAYFMLVRGGIPEERIIQVSGFADRRLKVPDDPYSELNRRIEILIDTKES